MCDEPALLSGLELGLPFDPLEETLGRLVSCLLDKLARLAERTGELPRGRDGALSQVAAERLLSD